MLKEADVVLVNGTLVTANAENQYSDLFRALKGGANRFGIVTRYELHAVHVGKKDSKNFYGGLIDYPDTSVEALLNATARYVREIEDPNASLFVVLMYTNVKGHAKASHFVVPVYRGTHLPRDIFGEFLDIPSKVGLLGPKDYSETLKILGKADHLKDFGQQFGGSAFTGDTDLYRNAYKHWKSYLFNHLDDIFTSALTFTIVPQSQVQAGRQRGGNAINPPLRSYAAVLVHTQFLPGVRELPDDLERDRQSLLGQIPPSPGLPIYVGESDAKQNSFSTYGSYEFLKSTYAKYDPTRFNVQFTDGPIGL
jgi:hypothetical protein